jgi:hypothetical protein
MCSGLPRSLRDRPALLVVAHPGHELRVHGWLELARPEVWVLTDGSGHHTQGRMPSTRAVLERAGATPGPVFGAFTDRDTYGLLLAGDPEPFADVARRLAERLAAAPDLYVVADALEGFNPSHDLCRVLVEAAATLARGRSGYPVEDFDFPLEASPDTAGARGDGDVRLLLDPDAVARKLEAARHYPELAAEVERAFAAHGEAAFAVERLRPSCDERSVLERLGDRPSYERYGEERVAAGHYPSVLRLREHFLPLVDALRARVGG